jgi:hypothetical protein
MSICIKIFAQTPLVRSAPSMFDVKIHDADPLSETKQYTVAECYIFLFSIL